MDDIRESSEQTFLFEDVEVRLTGRTATRKLRSGKIDERMEITPLDKMQGVWKKWVRCTDLYEIGE